MRATRVPFGTRRCRKNIRPPMTTAPPRGTSDSRATRWRRRARPRSCARPGRTPRRWVCGPGVRDDGRRLVQASPRACSAARPGLEVAQPALDPLDLLPHPGQLALHRRARPAACRCGCASSSTSRSSSRRRVGGAGRQVHELLAHVLGASTLTNSSRPSGSSPPVSSSNRVGGHLELEGGLAELVLGRPARCVGHVAAEPAGEPPQLRRWRSPANPPRCSRCRSG